jgi:hypothetical protein
MFGIFKKKSQKEALLDKYKLLMEDAYALSKVNRAASDLKFSEASEILTQIENLKE